MTPYLVVGLIAGVVTALGTWALLRIARRFKLAPEVRGRDVHEHPTPRLGGVAMFLGILVAFGFASTRNEFSSLYERTNEVWALLGACTIIAIIGVLDDLLDLDWMIKLAAQLCAAALLAWNGVQIVSVPFGDTLVVGSPAVNFGLTVFLMVLVMNAVNFVDGLDGLVAGVAIIANALFLVYTRLLADEIGAAVSVTFASLIAAVVVGMCLGFLPFNWHRAKMFMGDTGALLVGLMMATSTVSVTGKLNPASLDQKLVLASYIPIILPMAVLALPLADFALAVFRRLRAGKSPFTADRQHLHHRLLDRGHSPVQAVLIFYLGTAVISVAVLLVFVMQSWIVPVLVLVLGGALCIVALCVPVKQLRASRKERALLRSKSAAASAEDDAPDTPGELVERESDS